MWSHDFPIIRPIASVKVEVFADVSSVQWLM